MRIAQLQKVVSGCIGCLVVVAAASSSLRGIQPQQQRQQQQDVEEEHPEAWPFGLDSSTIDGNTLSKLEWGIPTDPLTLEAGTNVEWELEIPSMTVTRCTLSAPDSTYGDVDLGIHSNYSMLCASTGPGPEEECVDELGNPYDLDATIALFAFDDAVGLVLTCTNEPMVEARLNEQSTLFNIPMDEGQYILVYLNVSSLRLTSAEADTTATTINCSMGLHYFQYLEYGDIWWFAFFWGPTFDGWDGGMISDPTTILVPGGGVTDMLLAFRRGLPQINLDNHYKVSLLCKTTGDEESNNEDDDFTLIQQYLTTVSPNSTSMDDDMDDNDDALQPNDGNNGTSLLFLHNSTSAAAEPGEKSLSGGDHNPADYSIFP